MAGAIKTAARADTKLANDAPTGALVPVAPCAVVEATRKNP